MGRRGLKFKKRYTNKALKYGRLNHALVRDTAMTKRYVAATLKRSGTAFKNFGGKHPFPINWRCAFVYSELQSIQTPNLSNVCGTTYFFGLNALYDVYLAAGGHQPYGFDQLISSTGPYYRYKVHGVKIELEFFDPPTDTGLQVVCAVHNPVDYAAGSTISGLSIDKITEKHNAWSQYITPTGSQSVRVTKYFPMYKLFNLTKSQYKNDISSTTGAYNGNPSSTPVLEIGVLDVRSGAVSQLYVKGTLTYYTQCYDRAQLSQS